MEDLISEGIARLAGTSSQAVFHLKQAMGGGKTHLLVGFGLLAKYPALRQKYCAGCQVPWLWVRLKSLRLTAATILTISSGVKLPANLERGISSEHFGLADRRPRTRRTGLTFSMATSPF